MVMKEPAPSLVDQPEAVKESVQAFYDHVGWQQTQGGRYQNTIYEDLRPVAQEYIHRCHLRVLRHLNPTGMYLLDAGSGPIQYPEYITYSHGYRFRVCVDISSVALQEARKRIEAHGLFVVADIANLPFKPGCFGGVVSLHTIHHLPESEHLQAYQELYRVLAPGASAVVVNGWKVSPLMRLFDPIVRRLKKPVPVADTPPANGALNPPQPALPKASQGTFVNKNNAAWLKTQVGGVIPLRIYCWRSVSVGFMRALIHPRLAGHFWLRILFWLEDLFPGFFGEKGQYPLVVIRRPGEN